MLIFEGNSFQTLSTNPDDNWIEDYENYNGPKLIGLIKETERPDLIEKIEKYAPNFKLEYENDNITVKDVIKTEYIYSEDDIENYKYLKIDALKQNLNSYINNYKIKYIHNGIEKLYSITEEKQNRILNLLYESKLFNNKEIMFNASEDTSEIWSYEELKLLYKEIKNTVTNIVEQERIIEKEILKLNTMEDILNINISFNKNENDYFDIYNLK